MTKISKVNNASVLLFIHYYQKCLSNIFSTLCFTEGDV